MGNHKFLKAVTAVAAIGGVCYLFKDKIKETSIYQSMDVDDKVEKVKTTIKEKVPAKVEEAKEYFTMNNDDCDGDAGDDNDINVEFAETEGVDAEAATEDVVIGDEAVAEEAVTEEAPAESAPAESAPASDDISAMVDDLVSDIPTINLDSKL